LGRVGCCGVCGLFRGRWVTGGWGGLVLAAAVGGWDGGLLDVVCWRGGWYGW
jgi:hypothetical protein